MATSMLTYLKTNEHAKRRKTDTANRCSALALLKPSVERGPLGRDGRVTGERDMAIMRHTSRSHTTLSVVIAVAAQVPPLSGSDKPTT